MGPSLPCGHVSRLRALGTGSPWQHGLGCVGGGDLSQAQCTLLQIGLLDSGECPCSPGCAVWELWPQSCTTPPLPSCLVATCAGACCLRSPLSSSAYLQSDYWRTCQMSCWKPGPGWQVSSPGCSSQAGRTSGHVRGLENPAHLISVGTPLLVVLRSVVTPAWGTRMRGQSWLWLLWGLC